MLEFWADQRESARADIRGRAPYRSQIDKINTLSLEMTMLDNQTRKYQFFYLYFHSLVWKGTLLHLYLTAIKDVAKPLKPQY